MTLPNVDTFGADVSGKAPAGLHSEILYSILDLQFDRTDSMLGVCLTQEPGDAHSLYLQNYLEFLNAVISGDRDSFERYLEASGKRIESIRDEIKSNPESLSYLCSIYLHSFFLRASHGEMFKAARNFYSSHRYLRQSEEENPGYAENLRNRGVITLVTGSMPDDYHWLLKVFGMEGETGEGFNYLWEYQSTSLGANRLEACLLLLYAGQIIDPGNLGRDTSLCCEGDSITLCRYARALGDLSRGNSQGVVENLDNYRQEKGEREFPYLDLALGEALLNTLDEEARVPLKRFIMNHRGDSYRHYAWHKISWTYALSGDWEMYTKARQEVLQAGEALLDADRQALSEASDAHPLNIFLLKGRLLFDGGFYREALDHMTDGIGGLADANSSGVLANLKDSLEYTYRLARIHDRLGDKVIALEYYDEVIECGKDESWYFAPNASLSMGLIFEEDGQPEMAMEYYRRCLKINNSAYKSSIDYKARQGIHRLEN
ncbi:tetratricopeptide repeat protein [Bacteroidota bacterium]